MAKRKPKEISGEEFLELVRTRGVKMSVSAGDLKGPAGEMVALLFLLATKGMAKSVHVDVDASTS